MGGRWEGGREEKDGRKRYNRFDGYPGIVHPNDTFFDSSRCTTTTMTTMTILRVSVVSSRASERRRYNGTERIALKLITPPAIGSLQPRDGIVTSR